MEGTRDLLSGWRSARRACGAGDADGRDTREAQRELRATVTGLLAEGVAVTAGHGPFVGIHRETLTEWPPSTG